MHGVIAPGRKEWKAIEEEIEFEMYKHSENALSQVESPLAIKHTGYDHWLDAIDIYRGPAKKRCGRYFSAVAAATMGIILIDGVGRSHYKSNDVNEILHFIDKSRDEVGKKGGPEHIYRFFLSTKKIAIENLNDLLNDYPEIRAFMKKRPDYKEFMNFVKSQSLFPSENKSAEKVLQDIGDQLFPRSIGSMDTLSDKAIGVEFGGMQVKMIIVDETGSPKKS